MHVQDVLPRDAIPSIDEPAFASTYFGAPDDEVVVVEGDPPRAYPLRILSYHEIVNDTVDGRPVAVTWCPICASAVVYDRRLDGRTLTFGVSGKLADDTLVLYDRETESEWKQSAGTAIAGQLEGRELTVLPAPIVPYGRFAEDHPDGEVLQPAREEARAGPEAARAVYDMSRYERYFEGGTFGLRGMRGEGPARSWDREDLAAKTLVLGVERDGEAVGYPVPEVEAAGGVVTDTVGGTDVVIVTAGGGIHAFEHPGFPLRAGDGVIHGDGTTWDPTTGESTDGRHLERLPAKRLFAFTWQDDHGPDAFYFDED